MLRRLKTIWGFLISILAYSLLLTWVGMLVCAIALDYGPMPNRPAGDYSNRLYYQFVIAAFRAEVFWAALALISSIPASLYAAYLHRIAYPKSIGDWQPALLHVILTAIFGFLCFVSIILMSLAGIHYDSH